ncbi:hypothetical protein OIE68_45920 [Nocardia vinacea]|uniref:hypothetical protein n=1 Tax=Nocardia vinacea TaxID=96468 RepID=UPI002E0F3EEB|nr:hypothetical protein OIE68_45920 [Nocardia vinacea]
MTGTLTAAAEVAFQIKANTSIELQIAQLAEQQRKWQTRFAAIEQQLSMHKHEMALAREHAESVANQARAEAQADMKAFGDALDKVTALDLRWAIAGILINSVGVAMCYWT